MILQNVDLFYFSGTIQGSYLYIPSEGDSLLMVQKDFDRARMESPEDDYAVTETGVENLTVSDDEIIVIPLS